MDTPSSHLNAMRAAARLIQNITDYVAMNVMANVPLAAGATPAMLHARGEDAAFAAIASALTVNIGTLDAEWADCMALAAEEAGAAGTPWVLGPVAAGAADLRRATCARLLDLRLTVVRGNASEIIALSGDTSGGRGPDATDTVRAAETAVTTRARDIGAVIEQVDDVTDGTRAARISDGRPHALRHGPGLSAVGHCRGACRAERFSRRDVGGLRQFQRRERVCRAVRARIGPLGARPIVNDRVIGTCGVHVGQSDGDRSAVRDRIGANMVPGLSVETQDQLAAITTGADSYPGVGPVRATASKIDHAAPLGFSRIARIASAADVPCMAIGGLGATDVAAVRAAGCDGLAIVSAISRAADPERAARSLVDLWSAP